MSVTYNFLQVIVLPGAVFLGSLPFLISFIMGISLGHRWLAYAVSLILTFGITLLSFRRRPTPELIREHAP